jgi:peptidoglycan/xylan/chitin deacetylase (PgdA/CDA1 family)
VAVCLHSLEEECYAHFEEMVLFFREQGYLFSDPDAFLSEAPPARRLLLTFDDNFKTWHDALPLFARLDLTGTFYINTFPLRDRASVADIAGYYKRIGHHGAARPLTSTEIRNLATHGHIIGNHTYAHHQLSALALEEAIEQIRRGRAELEDILGQPVLHFAYPFGMTRHFSVGLRDYCRESGLRTVAAAIPGLLHTPQRRFCINRTGWDPKRSLSYNLANVRVDGAWFERVTGRSAV